MLVPHRGSLQSFRQAPSSFFIGESPPLLKTCFAAIKNELRHEHLLCGYSGLPSRFINLPSWQVVLWAALVDVHSHGLLVVFLGDMWFIFHAFIISTTLFWETFSTHLPQGVHQLQFWLIKFKSVFLECQLHFFFQAALSYLKEKQSHLWHGLCEEEELGMFLPRNYCAENEHFHPNN